MAVKVLIYRRVRPGKESEISEAVRELRLRALGAPGYISGETLRSVEDPSLRLVISTWRSLEDFERWRDSPERKAIQERIEGLLAEPARVAAFEYEPLDLETLSRIEPAAVEE
jgi:heme-degrading monooxygenase HmoA